MCGVVECVSFEREVPVKQCETALKTLRHRGPDGSGSVSIKNTCFGHSHLSIVGPTAIAARQPAHDENHLLAFYGEIYNYQELASELFSFGVASSGLSDTEVLFQSLVHWGVEKTLSKLDGMFAFGFYDKTKRELTLARDRMGEKPLYWAYCDERLWFASEIKALLVASEVSSDPNLNRIDDYFFTGKVNGSETLFADVYEIEPGTILKHSPAKGPEITSYWQIEKAFDADLEQMSPQRFLNDMTKAVSQRNLSDVPSGILMSGGIDSITLVDLQAGIMGNGTLNLLFADNFNKQLSERPDVDLAQEICGSTARALAACV
jgi:asparagine synthase (glutamine-hydrolysing)